MCTLSERTRTHSFSEVPSEVVHHPCRRSSGELLCNQLITTCPSSRRLNDWQRNYLNDVGHGVCTSIVRKPHRIRIEHQRRFHRVETGILFASQTNPVEVVVELVGVQAVSAGMPSTIHSTEVSQPYEVIFACNSTASPEQATSSAAMETEGTKNPYALNPALEAHCLVPWSTVVYTEPKT